MQDLSRAIHCARSDIGQCARSAHSVGSAARYNPRALQQRQQGLGSVCAKEPEHLHQHNRKKHREKVVVVHQAAKDILAPAFHVEGVKHAAYQQSLKNEDNQGASNRKDAPQR